MKIVLNALIVGKVYKILFKKKKKIIPMSPNSHKICIPLTQITRVNEHILTFHPK